MTAASAPETGMNGSGRASRDHDALNNGVGIHRTRVLTMKKPFDVLAEGLISKNSRGDKTAIDLFVAGARSWEGRWLLCLGV